jgi:hypothetical protein
MPGTAKQKRFMTMVKAQQHGHNVGGTAVAKAASSMKAEDVQDFVGAPATKPPVRSKEAMKAKWKKER